MTIEERSGNFFIKFFHYDKKKREKVFQKVISRISQCVSLGTTFLFLGPSASTWKKRKERERVEFLLIKL